MGDQNNTSITDGELMCTEGRKKGGGGGGNKTKNNNGGSAKNKQTKTR